jgi:hypothetical protein
MGGERRESNEGEKDSNEKNHPLSRESWIMLLSGEINKEEMKLTSHWNACIVIVIAFLGIEVAFLVIGFQSGVVYDGNVHVNGAIFRAILILIILVLAMFIPPALIMKIYEKRLQDRLNPLINTREAIISDELTDFSEIHRKWNEYIKKYYGKHLEKSEMDEEEKESKGEKDDSKEKDLEKKQ